MPNGSLSRRGFLATGAAAVAAGLLPRLFERRAAAAPQHGPLLPDPDGLLDLPAGFRYRIVDRRGQPMSDGYRTPGRPDGMACFAGPDGTRILLRNHELSPGDRANSPYAFWQPPPPEAYSSDGIGGVTRVVVDGEGQRVSSNLVLVGTMRNCAGGPSPWGWLSCEENVSPGHGYVFVCPADAASVQPPMKLPGYGRFNHEAVAIDPETLSAYLTEDRPDGCLYRFLPDDPSHPFVGRLQVMAIEGRRNFDTGWMKADDVAPVTWIDIQEPEPVGDTVRGEAAARGAARVRRGEGIWYAGGAVYFTATIGGPVAGGQVFRLALATQRLTLVAESLDRSLLDMPDNITMAPWGELFVCEDGPGGNSLRIITASGKLATFARNARSPSEMCGVCFAPDGSALFVNIQEDGLTLMVTGPFPMVAPPLAPEVAEPPVRTSGAADAGVRSGGDALGGDAGPDGGGEAGGCSAAASGADTIPLAIAGALVVAGVHKSPTG